MDAKIKLLAEQAWLAVEGPKVVEHNIGGVGVQFSDMRDELIEELGPILEHLVGLVVKECAKVVDDKLDFENAYGPDDWASGQDLLNHFNIKD